MLGSRMIFSFSQFNPRKTEMELQKKVS